MTLSPSRYPISLALIGTSIVLTLLTNFGTQASVIWFLFGVPGTPGFAAIAAGQVWRLITPIFLHFSILHLFFNLLWMWSLGRIIEVLRGPLFYIAFTLLVGIAANATQFLLSGNLLFGGLSGVIYGLLGYTWMRDRHNPNFAVLDRSTVVTMFGWYLVCWTGLIGHVANWAHTAGLAAGILWGLIDAQGGVRRPAA